MERVRIAPRPDWRAKVEARGLIWHTLEDGRPYWNEAAYWRFTADEIDRIEAATNDLYALVLDAIGHVIQTEDLAAFGYDQATADLIRDSWANRGWEPSLYARFDLAYDGHDLKLLELNGDTPTALVEAAVVQWWWLEERFPDLDQFNSLHEHLVAAFALYAKAGGGPVHFTCVSPHPEDEGTVEYLAVCAAEAGVETAFVALSDIGLADDVFVDLQDRAIATLFKLAPWEWMLADGFGPDLIRAVRGRQIRLIEPAWKMLASNKRLLSTLWARNPGHPLLLETTDRADIAAGWGEHVRKPIRGREGANVAFIGGAGQGAERGGAYGDDPMIYQRRAALAEADGIYAVLGSWVVNREACGLGVRESDGPITDNLARFTPHVIED